MPSAVNAFAPRGPSDLEYPGQIKVTVIRESRVSEVAR